MTGIVEGVPASGANRVLWTSTAAFTACFAVWTIFSLIGSAITEWSGRH